jgi:TonB family protein
VAASRVEATAQAQSASKPASTSPAPQAASATARSAASTPASTTTPATRAASTVASRPGSGITPLPTTGSSPTGGKSTAAGQKQATAEGTGVGNGKPADSGARGSNSGNAPAKEVVVGDLGSLLAKPTAAPALNTHYTPPSAETNRFGRGTFTTPQLDTAARVRFSFWDGNVRKKIERMGLLNFPRDDNGKSLYGRVRLRLILNGDGRLVRYELLESSGNPQLDAGAQRIVDAASQTSYGPVPEASLNEQGQIVLDRTLIFDKDGTGLLSQ